MARIARPAALRRLGVLGLNRRNTELVLPLNPRARYPMVDDKSITKALCVEHHIPVPETYALIERFGMTRRLAAILGAHTEFVLKPARGAGGRGVLVIAGRDGETFVTSTGEPVSVPDLRYQVSSILSGMHSLGGLPDRAIVEERIRPHGIFESLAVGGTPDIRIILHQRRPVMAMIRLPTRRSAGRANLHQGGVGVGVDLARGVTTYAVLSDRPVTQHPDTGAPLAGVALPLWRETVAVGVRLAEVLDLGYVGIDLVLDPERGPMVLEANARPGLTIQMANRQGLLAALAAKGAGS